MDNKQLLERAADAAGYHVEWNTVLECFMFTPKQTKEWYSQWKPLDNDADAFRLMVDCNVTIDVSDYDCEAWIIRDDRRLWISEFFGHHHGDKHSAARMAIVKAAAQSQEGGK